MKLVIASHNAGKIAEIRALLADLPIELHTQAEFGVQDIPETATTFIGNALLKAHHVCKLTGLATLADDSGLEIDALQGAPGVYSARYAGEPADFQKNIDKVLQAMTGLSNRKARFRSVCVLLRHPQDPAPWIGCGEWSGQILTERRGTAGFGYDPIFYVPQQSCSAAELSLDVKNHLSHRAQALQQLKTCLREHLSARASMDFSFDQSE